MGQLSRGVSSPRLPIYVPGYILGTKKEAPSAHIFLTSNITFAGFVSDYDFATPGVILVTQDAVGGHTINWDGKLLFNGSSTLNAAANTRTIIDVLRMPGGNWIGTIRGQYGGGGTGVNGLPAGGTTGQFLRKSSTTDYDSGWANPTKADVGLSAVDNTPDSLKPVSTPTQTALNLKAPILNPEFAGLVKIPGPSGAGAGLNLALGFPPLTPVDGDIWPTTDGFFGRLNGTTIQLGGRTTVAIQDFQMAASDLTTPLTAVSVAAYVRVSRAGTISLLSASLLQASTTGDVTVDVKVNGVSILSTPITIEATELSSLTAAVQPVISTATLAVDDEVTVEIVDPGVDALGLIVTFQFEDTVNPAAGFDTQVQWNDGGTFGASNQLTWNKTTNTLTVTNLTVTNGISGVMTNPMTTPGDMVVGGTSGAPVRLAGGSANQFLRYVGATPVWTTITKAMVGLTNADDTADNAKNVLSATKWTTPRSLTFTGDATGSVASVDGSANVSVALTLKNSVVTPGIYQQVQVDAHGIVIDGTNPDTLAGYGITDGLSNPMTTEGSIIYGGAVLGGTAQPTPLGIGTVGQILSVTNVSGTLLPRWNTIPTPFANPMTTAGDMIMGTTAGAAIRLPVGTNDQILRMAAGAPSWVNSPYLISPTTTQGDLILRGASADARLPKGTTGQFLISGASTLAWGSSIPDLTVTGTVTFTGATVTGLTKAMVGLSAVNNTADTAKDVLSASKWTTARTITLTGDVTGSVSIDGTSNVNLATTVAVGDALEIWVNKTADYTLAASDHGDVINMNSASPVTVTIPLNATVPIPIGTRINVYFEGAGTPTVDVEAGVTLHRNGPMVLPWVTSQYAFITFRKKATDLWVAILQ